MIGLVVMPRRCQLTQKGTKTGNNVSHSHVKTRRKFKVNVHRKKIFLSEQGKWVRMNVSTRALRTLMKKSSQ